MADVQSTLRLWTAIAANNSPSGATLIGANLDDNIRQIQAVVRQFLASPATDMASASTLDLSTADGFYINVTGTTAITSLGTEGAGIHYILKFAGALTFTHNATSLILPGGVSRTTAAGDIAWVMSEGGGNWRCLFYEPAAGDIPSGVVMPFAGSTVPGGWLICDGSAVSRTTYATLFSAISTTYGTGDGSTTFNVPDLRGRAVFGKDNMGGSAASRVTNGNSGITGTTLGAAGGSELLHQHNHTGSVNAHTHGLNSGSGITAGNISTGNTIQTTSGTTLNGLVQLTATDSATPGVTINNAGTGSSQNMPPAIILNYIIKT